MTNHYAPPRANVGSLQPGARYGQLAIAALMGAATWPMSVFAVLFADSAVWPHFRDGYPPEFAGSIIFTASACVAIVTCLVLSIWSRNAWYLQWLCFLLGACICVLVLAYFQNGSITLGLVILRRHAFVGLALASFGTLAGVAYARSART
jgi:hypothetical protein